MEDQPSLRTRKKVRTRHQIADCAAQLFARNGYDAVSVADIARAADVSDQTVYNYFPSKQDLVLDRAEQIRGWYDQAIRERGTDVSPAMALSPIVEADISRYENADLGMARGEFLAQCVASPVLHRFALEERERQVDVVAEAIHDTDPALDRQLVQLHASALIAAVHLIHHQLGSHILAQSNQTRHSTELRAVACQLLRHLDDSFALLLAAP